MMKKYRFKIDSPWANKDEVHSLPDFRYENYPDLFEEVFEDKIDENAESVKKIMNWFIKKRNAWLRENDILWPSSKIEKDLAKSLLEAGLDPEKLK